MFVCFFFGGFFLYKNEGKYSLLWFGNFYREKWYSLAAGTALCSWTYHEVIANNRRIHCSGMALKWIRLWYLCRVRCFNINGCVNLSSLFIGAPRVLMSIDFKSRSVFQSVARFVCLIGKRLRYEVFTWHLRITARSKSIISLCKSCRRSLKMANIKPIMFP